MLSNRISLGLAAFLLVVSAGISAYGQDHEVQGLDFFEPADLAPYDNWAEPRQGLFFTFDGLYWHISPPNKTTIGDPTLVPTVYYGSLANAVTETNSLDTSAENLWKWGDRTEIGYMINEHHGFMFTGFLTESQTSETSAANVNVVFDDPLTANGNHLLNTLLPDGNIGRTPVTFSSMYVQDKPRMGGVEALYIYRMTECPLGGNLEFTLGGRYLEIKDQFWVDARGGNLTDSDWNTTAHNEISGPELGMRYYQPCGRFGISAETRFTAGINAQSILQTGILAAGLNAPNPTEAQQAAEGLSPSYQYPTLMSATSFIHSTHWVEFSPVVELRVEGHLQLTNLISVKAGYTGLFVNNVARSADMILYQVPSMGITRDLNGNLQPIYAQGLNLSIEFNR